MSPFLAYDYADMARDIICTPNAPSAPPTYSQAVRAGGFVFVSGTPPVDSATGTIAGETVQEQTRQCLKNVPPGHSGSCRLLRSARL